MELTYNISQTVNSKVNIDRLQYDVEDISSDVTHISSVNGVITIYSSTELSQEQVSSIGQAVSSHEGSPIPKHRIEQDTEENKGFLSINYKTELKDGISYHPVYTINDDGLLEKTEYFRGFVDENNKGELVLQVEEVYDVNEDVSIPKSAREVNSREKTWKHYRTDGVLDEKKKKRRPKKYDTREKRHKEGVRRRANLEEQLIDRVSLAGSLSGAFVGSNSDEIKSDAYNKLTTLQETHSSSFSAWRNSGRGSIYNDLSNESISWVNIVVPDTPSTQVKCPWIIGMTLKGYMVEKLKGEIK